MKPKTLWFVILMGFSTPAVAMPPPPPGTKFTKLALYDGPGQFCAAVLSIRLKQGEFVIARRKNAWSVDFQIELQEGRLTIHNTTAGNSSGDFVKNVGEGRLLKTKVDGKKVYSYDNGVWGQSLISGFNFKSRQGRKLLDRINFSSPRNSKVGDDSCLTKIVIQE